MYRITAGWKWKDNLLNGLSLGTLKQNTDLCYVMEDGELTMTVSTHQQNIKQCLAAFRKLVSGSGGEEEVRVGCCYSPDTTKVELCLTIPCSSSGHLSCFPQNMIKITLAKPRQEFKSHCCPLMQTSHGFKKVFPNPN